MKNVVLVFIGGGFGSVLRFAISKWLNTENGLPYGTFVSNVLGSLLIGLILGYAAKSDSFTQQHTLLLATGFCGGFTTFSTFAFENQLFLKSGDFTSFALYTIGSFAISLLAVFSGIYLIKFI